MAANHTPVFRLNQWQADDPVLREDFNTDNQTLENALNSLTNNMRFAGNAQVEYSSYTGSGGSKVSLTFDKRPLMVLVMGFDTLLIPGQPSSGHLFYSGSASPSQFQWKDNTVSWNTPTPNTWNNEQGRTYHYFALFHTAH